MAGTNLGSYILANLGKSALWAGSMTFRLQHVPTPASFRLRTFRLCVFSTPGTFRLQDEKMMVKKGKSLEYHTNWFTNVFPTALRSF